MICMKQLGFSMRKMIFPSVIDTSDSEEKIPVFQKADLDGMVGSILCRLSVQISGNFMAFCLHKVTVFSLLDPDVIYH